MVRKIGLVLVLCCISLLGYSQEMTARKVLDKAAAQIGNKSGVSANFVMNDPKLGNTTGSLSIKGNKFQARTPQAIVWFDGKTQWSYLKSTNEVSITTPNETQRMSMNPYTFINMYKTGYDLTMKTLGTSYQVKMVATGKQSIPEMYILVNKKTYVPHEIKMKRNGTWLTITISNFSKKNLSDAIFTFKSKDIPTAEVIDLR